MSRTAEGAARKVAADRERAAARHGGVLRFLGNEYATVLALRLDYPAFAGDDCLRALRAGCTTPLEVEVFCTERRRIAYAKSRESARNSQHGAKHALPPKNPKRRRK